MGMGGMPGMPGMPAMMAGMMAGMPGMPGMMAGMPGMGATASTQPAPGMPGMPGMAMAMPYQMQMPYGYGQPAAYPGYPMQMAYTIPYYVMPSTAALQTGPGAPVPPPGAPAPPMSPEQRQNLTARVKSQLEYYFGQENLIKDVFLRSRLMNEEGWVAITSVAGFRRIQSMTIDMTIILEAIADSKQLEVHPSGQQIRLKNNWQEWVLSPTTESPNGKVAAPPQA
mmetsp:Transcript_91195/g.203605  ORF Transcript_91195/g.203605 Transcript_91195/m.203605 type:complete len:225 (-) Transcript_91195:707-1381(-)